jgi:hypothetical protein
MSRKEKSSKKQNHQELVKLIFRGIIPIVFLGAGVAILALRIQGWSLLLGIPVTIFGVVFLIYTYDEVVRDVVGQIPDKQEMTKCRVCGKPTPRVIGIGYDDTICPKCKRDIGKGIKKEKD